MKVRVGYEFICTFPQGTPMILPIMSTTRGQSDIVTPDDLKTDRPCRSPHIRDGFRNRCSRMVAPPGRMRASRKFLTVFHNPAACGSQPQTATTTTMFRIDSILDAIWVYRLIGYKGGGRVFSRDQDNRFATSYLAATSSCCECTSSRAGWVESRTSFAFATSAAVPWTINTNLSLFTAVSYSITLFFGMPML